MLGLLVAWLFVPSIVIALPGVQNVPIPPQDVKELSDFYAAKYGVNPYTMRAVIQCENGWQNSQSQMRYTKDHPEWGVKKGDRELSFGLVQIHLPAHPDITQKQAQNYNFALDFLAKNLAQGHGSMWTCFK